MAKTILINGGQSFIVSGGASYWDFNLIGNLGTSYTGSAALKLLFHNAGTLSNATIYISTNTRNAVLTLTGRKNSSDGNISVSITALGTGFFEDVSHTDSVTSGDTYQYRLDYGGTTEGGLTIQNIQTTFSATTDTVSILGHGQDAIDSWATSTTFWLGLWPLDTDNASGNTEANRQIEIRKAGSFKNLAVYVYFASSAAHTFKLRKNGGDAISISLTANTSGWFEETSTTSTAAVGDDYCFSFVTGANTTNLSINTWKIDYINTSGYGMTCVGDRYMQALTKGLTRYNNIGGSTMNLLNNTSETGLQYKSRDTYTFSELEAYVVNATITGNYIKLRKNGADTALVLSIPSGHTGLVQDTSNTVTVAAGDLMNFVVANVYAGGGTRNLNVYWIAVWYQGPALYQSPISETSVSVSDSISKIKFGAGPNNKSTILGTDFYHSNSPTSPQYTSIAGQYHADFSVNYTESNAQIPVRPYGGTFSNLYYETEYNTLENTLTVRVRKNGADGNIVLSLAAGQTGVFEDTTHTDTFANGDLFCISTATTTGDGTLYTYGNMGIAFKSTNTNTVTRFEAIGDTSTTYGSVTSYTSLNGLLTLYATESSMQTPFKTLTKLSNLLAIIDSNARTTTTTIRIRKNTADGNQILSIGSEATGRFEDTSNTDFCNVDDLVNYSVTTGSGSQTINFKIIAVTSESDTGLWKFVSSGSTAVNSNLTTYSPITGHCYFYNYQDNGQSQRLPFNATWKNLSVNITANSLNSGTSTYKGHKRPTTETALSVSVGFGQTGFFHDTVNTASVTSSDFLNIKLVTSGTSGSITCNGLTSEFEESEVTGELKYGTITESPSVSVSESLARVQTLLKPISDTPTVSVSESLARIQTLLKEISDTPTVSVSELLTRGLSYLKTIDESSISVSAGTLERIQYLIKQITNEPDVTIPLETLEKVAAYPRPISDTPTISVSETLERIRSSLRSISDTPTIEISELLAKSTLFPKTISDTPTVSISETLERIQTIIKQITNEPEVTISELIAGNFLISRIINESPSISVSETLERIQTALRSISDTPEIIISELLTGSVPVIIKNISEPSVTTDPTTIERLATFLRSITVAEEPLIDVSDTLASILSYLRNIANEPEITTNDVAAILALMTRTLAEPSQNISEDLARIQSILKEIAESPTIDTSDAAIALKLQTILLFESRIKWYYSTLTRKIPAGEV